MGDEGFTYSAYGLTFSVPFRCAGFPSAAQDAIPDLIVREGPVPRSLLSAAVGGRAWEADSDRWLHRSGNRGGRFLVERGNVTLERNRCAEDAVLATAFAGAALPAAITQRGTLVLHANAVAVGDRAVVIAGGSGVGKSTTAAAMLGSGAAMLADDVTALAIRGDGPVDVLPGPGELRLAREPAARLGLLGEGEPTPPQKWALPTGAVRAAAPVRLDRIYLLERGADQKLAVKPLSGAEKFGALFGCLYFSPAAMQQSAVLARCATVLQQRDVIRIRRPANGWSVEQVCSVVLEGSCGIGR